LSDPLSAGQLLPDFKQLPMTSRRNLGIASLLLGSILPACGGDSTSPPTTGTIDFKIVTTGADIDADGFLLAVGAGSPQVIPANGNLSISSLPGNLTLTISGLAFNCDVNAPASASVIVGQSAHVDVRASCTSFLRNAIVYVTDQFGFGEVMAMRPDGSRSQRLTTDQAVYSDPVVSPDGQTIAVASYVGGSWNGIYLLDRFGKSRTLLVSHAGSGAPAWSPDGTKVSFSGTLPGPYGDYGRIFVVNRDGTGLRQLSPEVAATDYKYDSGSSWSPDGTRLVFDRSGVLFLINADGTGLASTGVNGANPAWSPDGTQIAYGSINLDGIWAMNLSFTPRRLTTAVQQDEYPAWSPDGRQLVFERLENNVFHLYKIGADGSGAARMTSGPQDEFEPAWTRNF
jgi:Tol biopolymer transport system component